MRIKKIFWAILQVKKSVGREELEEVIQSDFESEDAILLSELIRRNIAEWKKQIEVWITAEKSTETGGPNVPDNTETPKGLFGLISLWLISIKHRKASILLQRQLQKKKHS